MTHDGHPYAAHRQHKVEHQRVGHITKGYASGGAVHHDDEAEDRAMIKHMVKRKALRAEGGAVKTRLDRPSRAKGGRVKHGKTNVNVIVGGAHPAPAPMPVPVPPAGALSPRPMAPPMPPPGAGGPPGLPPGMPPPGIRRSGGRAFAKGGGVKHTAGGLEPANQAALHHSGKRGHAKAGELEGANQAALHHRARGGAVKHGPAFDEGRRNGTQVQHSGNKQDGKDIGRGKPVTYATGGPVEHPVHGGMAPDLHAGAGGGLGRLRKAKRAK